MSDDLKAELMEIHGIGEAKAEEILDVLGGAGGDAGDVRELLEDAVAYHEQGDHGYAAKFVRQALDRL